MSKFIDHVPHTPGTPAWAMSWHTPIMPGIAFWYFRDEKDAVECSAGMSAGCVTKVYYAEKCYATEVGVY